jgi:hypothetical protein
VDGHDVVDGWLMVDGCRLVAFCLMPGPYTVYEWLPYLYKSIVPSFAFNGAFYFVLVLSLLFTTNHSHSFLSFDQSKQAKNESE